MKRIAIMLMGLLAAVSCSKTIDSSLENKDVSLLELQLKGQMGTAVIERTDESATATVYVMATDAFDWAAVEVEGIVVSAGASASVGRGDKLNFNNPERRASVTVSSKSGNKLKWWINIKPYDAFYVGRWRIVEIKLCCNQRLASCGDGAWETQLSASEFGDFGMPEYDNRIQIDMNEGVRNNLLTGTITNEAGADGKYGHFWGVYSPYSKENPLDMDSRLRLLLPPGKSEWELDLTTNKMSITKDNVTSVMTFARRGDNVLFRFALPSAASEPSQNGFYDNMWRSSYELYYEVYKMK